MRRVRWGLLLVAAMSLLSASPAAADFTVTRFDDPAVGACDTDCSLREAVTAANLTGALDVVTLPAGTYQLPNDQLPTVTQPLRIVGAGAATTTITGADTNAAASPAGGVFAVNGANLTIDSVTISGNRVTGTANVSGGAIGANNANVTVTDSAITANRDEASSPVGAGGAMGVDSGSFTVRDSAIDGNVFAGTGALSGGGGIGATLTTDDNTILRSSVIGNRADSVNGGNTSLAGAVFVNAGGALRVTNSTVHGNSVAAGGAIFRFGGLAVNSNLMTIFHSTVTDNSTLARGTDTVGGNLYGFGGVSSKTVQNSIVAGGTPGNCNAAVTSLGGNIESANDCGFAAATGDLINTDPRVGVLANNGGPTRTQALLPGSPAFGFATTNCAALDQRSVARPVGGACDSGAYESTDPPANTAPPTADGTTAIGATLTCAPGAWTNTPTFAFSWLRNGTPIDGPATDSYAVTSADASAALQCQVTATNEAGSTVATSAPVVAASGVPVDSARPTVDGSKKVGKKVTCESGTWSESPVFAFAWLRDGKAIKGATGAKYKLAKKDAGHAVQCEVTATGPVGSTVADSAVFVPKKKKPKHHHH